MHGLAPLGQPDAAARAVDERFADLTLQSLDLLATAGWVIPSACAAPENDPARRRRRRCAGGGGRALAELMELRRGDQRPTKREGNAPGTRRHHRPGHRCGSVAAHPAHHTTQTRQPPDAYLTAGGVRARMATGSSCWTVMHGDSGSTACSDSVGWEQYPASEDRGRLRRSRT